MRSMNVASITDQWLYLTDQLEIWDRPAESSEACERSLTLPPRASRFERFFSLSLESERSGGETANRCRYTGASVFDRRQKFCESAARLDGLPKLSLCSNGVEGQIEPENKAPWTHYGPVMIHKCISHVRPSSEETRGNANTESGCVLPKLPQVRNAESRLTSTCQPRSRYFFDQRPTSPSSKGSLGSNV